MNAQNCCHTHNDCAVKYDTLVETSQTVMLTIEVADNHGGMRPGWDMSPGRRLTLGGQLQESHG